jgi:hypothetical protein
MQANDFGAGPFFKMALHRLADVSSCVVECLGLSKDGMAQRTRGIATVWCFFDKENDLTHLWLRSMGSARSLSGTYKCTALLDLIHPQPERLILGTAGD